MVNIWRSYKQQCYVFFLSTYGVLLSAPVRDIRCTKEPKLDSDQFSATSTELIVAKRSYWTPKRAAK